MTATSLTATIALGLITGMRSMAGPAALAVGRPGLLSRVLPMLAVGEMIADKTLLVGDRTDPLPLAGRALMAALVGGVLARETHGNVVGGAITGAVVAVAAAHVACHVRKQWSSSNALGGVIEDVVVIGIGSLYAASMFTVVISDEDPPALGPRRGTCRSAPAGQP